MITQPLTFNTYPIVFKELKFLGSLNYTKTDFKMALDMLASSPNTYAKLITHCFDFSECQKAFEMIHNKTEGFVKVLLKVQPD
jgi:L-iditol 2-dehydrogenase